MKRKYDGKYSCENCGQSSDSIEGQRHHRVRCPQTIEAIAQANREAFTCPRCGSVAFCGGITYGE